MHFLSKFLRRIQEMLGRGVARIDYDSMDTLNASTGDVIEIKGKRKNSSKMPPTLPI